MMVSLVISNTSELYAASLLTTGLSESHVTTSPNLSSALTDECDPLYYGNTIIGPIELMSAKAQATGNSAVLRSEACSFPP